jgi:holo-[acyl-carrier protein] synthase
LLHATGVDLIEVERIKKVIERWGERFLRRVFTSWEIAYCQEKRLSHFSFAARFAAKEATLKAIGSGLSEGVRWTSIEVVADRYGSPAVRLGQKIQRLIGDKEVKISMSHTKEYAIAVALLVDKGSHTRGL